MRVHELADELGVSTDTVLEVVNEDLGRSVEHHMNSIDEETVRRVRIALGDDSNLLDDLPGTSTLKDLYGNAVDSMAFGVGLGLLITSSHGDETRETIREEIRDLGKEVTDPIRIGGEEIIELLDVLPSQVDSLKNSALDFGSEPLDRIGPVVEGVVDEASHLIDSAGFSTNGADKTAATEESTR